MKNFSSRLDLLSTEADMLSHEGADFYTEYFIDIVCGPYISLLAVLSRLVYSGFWLWVKIGHLHEQILCNECNKEMLIHVPDTSKKS